LNQGSRFIMWELCAPKEIIKNVVLCLSLWIFAFGSQAEENHGRASNGCFTNLKQWPAVKVPKRVLLIPLLNKSNHSSECERWPEKPAALLQNFYRRQFQAKVMWLRNVHHWADYYREIDRLLAQKQMSFDRVIFIGHGGFDGPILNSTEVRGGIAKNGSEGVVSYETERQPGILQIFTLTYNVSKNSMFSTYVAGAWRELVKLEPDAAEERLFEMKKRFVPMDAACFASYCTVIRPVSGEDEAIRKIKLQTCEDICRGPLFTMETHEEIEPERFFRFAGSIGLLAKKDGLVFFGGCNAGSALTEDVPGWDSPPGYLLQSVAVGGPYV
jgi:hypothetical protein